VKQLNGTGQYIASMFDIAETKGSEKKIHELNSELMKMNDELRRELFERENYEKVLLHQANHDSLTGLPNRQLLFDRLNQAIAYVDRNSNMLALMLIDLDSFKPINDTLGHIAGDALLKEVAGRLQACLRKYDTVARFGGDEFVLIVNDMPDIHDIVRFAEKVLNIFQRPFDILGKPVCATASIGLAIYPLQSSSTDSLLKMADTAMYQAKSDGGNVYRFFTESMSIKQDRRALLENKLKAALEREEYLAHYQPRIDVATRKIIGMEALMRWQPIDEQLAYPADFFSILEESGMIVPVGEWLLEKICEQNRAWHDAGLPQLRVAVNISERQFKQDDFADRVSKALSNSKLEPRFLEIELPEQIIMNNVSESISRLKKLKSTGVSISVDNFGTGYSSLTHLNRLPIDDIQIDKSLINCIISDENDANVVSAIISMGHSLGKNLVAEGVESEEQFMFLAHRRCKEMQGHFFSRALSSTEFEKLARKYTL
jgi:diguanylate cyclase (GGDEF)-like protein